MPASERQRVELKCPSCGHSGIANIAIGSQQKTASADGFIVKVIAVNELEIVCPDCDAVALRIE
jgi:hypothetical protein